MAHSGETAAHEHTHGASSIYPNRIWVAADHAAISSKYENRMVDQANLGRIAPIENTPKKKEWELSDEPEDFDPIRGKMSR